MAASDHLNADQFEYTPRSYTHVDFLSTSSGPITSRYHNIRRDTGFEIAHHEVAATHPEHGQVGKAKWDDDGNIYVSVKPEFKRKGIGMRLVDEAHKYKPESALEGLTPVTREGQQLNAAIGRKYGKQ